MSEPTEPRLNAVVRFRQHKYPAEDLNRYYASYIGEHYIFMGEIPNQPGHCLLGEIGPRPEYVITVKGFFHTADFEEVPEDEL